MFHLVGTRASIADVLQVKNPQPKMGKKKAAAAGAVEVRVMVTVLMGFSFEEFGGPDAVETGVEKDTNGVEGGTEKRARPRSHRLRLATEAGVWPAETVSTQPADTDEAEVALTTLRNTPCCEHAQPAVTEPAVVTDCEAAGNSGVVENSGTCSQQEPVDDAAGATVDAAECGGAAEHDAEGRECSSAPQGEPDGDAVQAECMHDSVMVPTEEDTAADAGVAEQAEARARSTNQVEVQEGTAGTTAVGGEDGPDSACGSREMRAAPGPAADGATDTANSERAGAVTSPEADAGMGGACGSAPVCNGVNGNYSVERHNSSDPAELNQHAAAAADQAGLDCKREECIQNSGDRELPSDAAGRDGAGTTGSDEKMEAVGDVPDCKHGVGEVPSAIDFSHSEELRAAVDEPSALSPRLRPPPAELITCQASTTVRAPAPHTVALRTRCEVYRVPESV